ncbi:MAG: amidohydrolase [Lachnospiraceae bacterium]|nr:amidohydrolase [Lachnospiraceae bacterium]
MQVIDIHAHIYQQVAGITQGQPMRSTGLGRVAIGDRQVQFLPPSFEQTRSTAEMLLAYMDWCGIEKALLMPNPYYGYHSQYLKDSVRRYPDRLKGVALVDIMKGQKAAEELAAIYDEGLLFGFKVEVDSTFQCAPGTRLTDPGLAPVWDCCNQYRQPVFFHLFRTVDIGDVRELSLAYPHMVLVLCHMGADACFKKGMPKDNYRQVLDLVKSRPNVYMDTSTVPVYFQEEYPWPSSVEIIEECYRQAGPEKLMWSSDYPGMLNHGTMRQLINLVEVQCTRIPASHRQMILADNARRLFFGETDR